MSKWTPGPWQCGRFHETGPVAGIPINAEAADESIARAWLVDDPQECKANARLIAAAPEMAEEIEDEIFWLEVVSCYGENAERGRMLRIKTLRALLARINGDEK